MKESLRQLPVLQLLKFWFLFNQPITLWSSHSQAKCPKMICGAASHSQIYITFIHPVPKPEVNGVV